MLPRIKRLVPFILSRVIPPQLGLIIFTQPFNFYSGNARALFEWMFEAGYCVRWLYRETPPQAPGIPNHLFLHRSSWRGIKTAIRANVAVTSYGLGDYGTLSSIIRYRKVVMLWHGIGIKHLNMLDVKENPERILDKTRHYDLVTASSQIDRYYNAAHSHIRVDKVAVTGLPRNDRLLKLATQHRNRKDAPNNPMAILYAPTFRDYPAETGSLFFPFPDFDEQQLATELRRLAIQIILRPHAHDTASVKHCTVLAEAYPDLFKFSDAAETNDTATLIAETDAVISDYSSIYLDYVLLDKPCVFIPWDIDRYRETRGIAYEYDTITPGPKILSQASFVEALRAIAAEDHHPTWTTQQKMVRAMFYAFTDTNNCARAASEIDGLIKR